MIRYILRKLLSDYSRPNHIRSYVYLPMIDLLSEWHFVEGHQLGAK